LKINSGYTTGVRTYARHFFLHIRTLVIGRLCFVGEPGPRFVICFAIALLLFGPGPQSRTVVKPGGKIAIAVLQIRTAFLCPSCASKNHPSKSGEIGNSESEVVCHTGLQVPFSVERPCGAAGLKLKDDSCGKVERTGGQINPPSRLSSHACFDLHCSVLPCTFRASCPKSCCSVMNDGRIV
jgi:hypothetical protein